MVQGKLDSCPGREILTTLHLQQGFREDAAGHADRLADVISRVLHLDIGDGQLAAQRHGKTTRLRRLLGGEQQDLGETNITEVHVAPAPTWPDSCRIGARACVFLITHPSDGGFSRLSYLGWG